MKYKGLYILSFILAFYSSSDAQTVPHQVTRNLIQDKHGNIWMAAFDGVFRYDGKEFTNVTAKISSARFFSVLEDSEGNLWFGSIGSGVYRYNGDGFHNFTTADGLLNNEVGWIFEDRTGNLWFGVNGGASRYDGESFLNYMINGDTMIEDRTGKTFPDFTRPPNEVTCIIEGKTGDLWFSTRGNTYVYNGMGFVILKFNGRSFTNVRTMIEDRNGNIWFGGNDGLWRYDGKTFTLLTQNFVGYIFEDRNGNIWTSSNPGNGWRLSRYDEKLRVTEIKSEYGSNKSGLFGILEANDGSIWFGSADGVYRYDGKNVSGFNEPTRKE